MPHADPVVRRAYLKDWNILHLGRYNPRLRRRRAERRRLLIQMAGGKCVDCGYSEHIAPLEFDHRPGEPKAGATSDLLYKAAFDKAISEIAYCDLVCSNCHQIRTWNRLQEGHVKKEAERPEIIEFRRNSPWNKGLTKSDHRIAIYAAKISLSMMGKTPWNKGLTKEMDERVAKNRIP